MKHLAVDVGNVICSIDFTNFNLLLEQFIANNLINIPKEKIIQFLFDTQKIQDVGITSFEEDVRNYLGIKDKKLIELLVAEWNKTLKPNHFMISNLIDMLPTTKIAILSNMGTNHRSIMRDLLTPELYDNCIPFFSCDVGARKPSLLYYKTFLDMYPDFKGCVYLDDRQDNIDTSIRFGMTGCLFNLNDFKSIMEMAEMIAIFKQLIKN